MKREETQQFNAGPYVNYIWSIADIAADLKSVEAEANGLLADVMGGKA